jgi:hypothetical protein
MDDRRRTDSVQGTNDTRLRGRWLLLARVMWMILALLSVAMSLAARTTSEHTIVAPRRRNPTCIIVT